MFVLFIALSRLLLPLESHKRLSILKGILNTTNLSNIENQDEKCQVHISPIFNHVEKGSILRNLNALQLEHHKSLKTQQQPQI